MQVTTLEKISNEQQSSAFKIQSVWRGKRTRYKVNYFSNLPSDVWRIILCFLKKTDLYQVIDKLIRTRLIRLYWTPPHHDLMIKFQTLRLVRQYKHVLSCTTIKKAIHLAERLSYYIQSPTSKYFLNTFIKDFVFYLIP